MEDLFTQTLSQTIYHVGETKFEILIEDTLGYVYKKEFSVKVESDGPYVEGPSNIDVIPGTSKKVKYLLSKDTNTTVELKETIPGVTFNEYGDLLFNVPENFLGPGAITIVATNGLRVFEKEISINWVHSNLLATIPAGFYGKYTIHAPNSILDNTSIELTENMISNPTAINVLEAKSTEGTYLILKALTGEIINPLRIITNGDIGGRHEVADSSISEWFSPILYNNTYLTKVSACSSPILFRKILSQHMSSTLLTQYELDSVGGMTVIALGKRLESAKSKVPEFSLLNRLAIKFSQLINDPNKTIYIVDSETAKNWVPLEVFGFVNRYDTENIFINIDSALDEKNVFADFDEIANFFIGILRHESRHSQINTLFGCKRNRVDEVAFKFIIESEAEHFALKTASKDERDALLKHNFYSDYKNSDYFKLAEHTIEDSFNINTRKRYLNEYLFSGIWDFIPADEFFAWLIGQGREYKHSSNTQIFIDFFGGDLNFANFLMEYERKLIYPLNSNNSVINEIGKRLVREESVFGSYRDKNIKKVDNITLESFSTTLRTIRKDYLAQNNLINADGVAFVETIADGVEGVYEKITYDYSEESILKGEQQDDPSSFNRVSVVASDCEQCELLFTNLSSSFQRVEILLYGATKIVSDPGNKLWPTNGTTITWDGTMYIKHYQSYSEITDENAIHSRVDVGNFLYVNHLAPVYIWDCGNGGEVRCGYKLIPNLSLDNNYIATLKSDSLGTCGFTGERCYNISIMQQDSVVLSEPLFNDFVKFFSISLFSTAYAQDFYYPLQPLRTPQEVLGVSVEDKRQIKNEN